MPPERRGRRPRGTAPPVEPPKHQRLSHPFEAQALFSADAVEAIHADALRVLEELGLRILSPEAVTLFQRAGARVEGDMVRIGRDIVDAALASAPREIPLWAANPAHAQIYAPGTLLFGPGAGCPNVHDRLNGRRPGDRAAYEAAIRLAEATPQIHILAPMVEPQDVPNNTRHYAIMEAQLTLASKPLYINARGRGQVAESLEMIDRALSPPAGAVTAYAVINTNSPRLIDRPMADGLIDLARAGQLSIVTPFCLAGAMAPITLAGALTLQHAEALAGIALTQIAKPGAPVSYGGFGSNVDMKSGAPAFGTPEHLKLQIGTGQLARRLGLPWRSAAGSASNTTDMQAATETAMGLWGAL
ncbi:MAG: trimethylamine methyltransferase family protein, partial [Pseudomonadota bacterium]